jgi:signal transduction histidine kinase
VSGAALLMVAWIGVYGYLGLAFLVLHLRGGREPMHFWFGLFASSFAVYTAGGVWTDGARSIAELLSGMTLMWVALAACVPLFARFVHAAMDVPMGWPVRAATAWAALGAVLAVAGVFFDLDGSRAAVAEAVFGTWPTPLPRLTVFGIVWAAGLLVFTAHAVALLARAARGTGTRARSARILLAANAGWVVAGLHDLIATIVGSRTVFLLEHVGMLSAVGTSWILLDRVRAVRDELERRTRELERSHAELRQAQEELLAKEHLATVGELSAVIAHEVRNPLAVLKNAASSLRREGLSEDDRRTLLDILDEENERLALLVNDLLAYARPLTVQQRDVPIADLVRRALDAVCTATGIGSNGRVRVDLRLGGAPAALHGDADLLRQALINVLENAIQAMPEGGDLTVEGAPSELDGEPALKLRIRDTGVGMDTLVRQKARDPFFTTRPTGTGLGLAIVDRVARAHGGRLDIDSAHNQGTEVTLTLPLRRTSVSPSGPSADRTSPATPKARAAVTNAAVDGETAALERPSVPIGTSCERPTSEGRDPPTTVPSPSR